MRRKFKKAVTMLTYITVTVAQCQTPVLADTPNETNHGTREVNNTTIDNGSDGTVIDNNGVIGTNDGTVNNNNSGAEVTDNKGTVQNNNDGGLVKTNEKDITTNGTGGKVETNCEDATIETNNGDVDDNYGTIEINANYLNNNFEGGFVQENAQSGQISLNDDGAFVDRNHGQIDRNEDGGIVQLNTGYIEQNDGIVGLTNDDDIEQDSDGPSGLGEEIDVDTSSGNFGIIENNSGLVTFNAGVDDRANLTYLENISDDILEGFEGGVIEVNRGVVIVNNGTVGNYKGGTVEKNNGSVYNYGGVITDNSTGTEYFRVTINSGSNVNKNESSLTSYDGEKWIGQQGEKQNTTEITISPSSGYYISGINVPSSLSSHVSVRSNPDGTWTISVKSGTNIRLSIPDAISSYSDDSSDSDDDDYINNDNKTQDTGSPGNILINLLPMDPQGNPVSVNLNDVVKSLDNPTEAMNYFSSPVVVNLNEIQGYGKVDLAALFLNQTADNISVPVAANVVAGKTYTVYLNNGDPISITCTQNGQLLIPFGKGSLDVTFIICGEALTPFTGDNLSDKPGPASPGQNDTNEHPVTVTQDIFPSGPAGLTNLPSLAGPGGPASSPDTLSLKGPGTSMAGFTLTGTDTYDPILSYEAQETGNLISNLPTSAQVSFDDIRNINSALNNELISGNKTPKIGHKDTSNNFNYYGITKESELPLKNDDSASIWLESDYNLIHHQGISNIDASASKGEEILAGGNKGESLIGSTGTNSLWGGTGSDSLWGGAGGGNDTLFGGNGHDTFFYGTGLGNDTIVSGTDEDQIMLYNVQLSDLNPADTKIKDGKMVIPLNDGSSLTINSLQPSATHTTFSLADSKWTYNKNTGQWQQSE